MARDMVEELSNSLMVLNTMDIGNMTKFMEEGVTNSQMVSHMMAIINMEN